MNDQYPKPRWDLENDILRLEQMIILYEQEIEQLNIEKKELKKEIIEMKDHPFFFGTQYHPEFKSRPNRPSPPFHGLIKAALGREI